MKQNRGIYSLICVATALVVVGMACSGTIKLPTRTSSPGAGTEPQSLIDLTLPEAYPHPQAKGLSMGDPKAPVVVIVYADFQCPGCKRYSQSDEPQLIEQYIATGKVYYTFVPDSFIDEFSGSTEKESKHAAEAAYCASEQNKFWDYHDLLFANQAAENTGGYNDNDLIAMAKFISLDTVKLKACYNSHRYQQQVLDDETASAKAGVSQVPSFTVNGKLVTADILTATIDAALK